VSHAQTTSPPQGESPAHPNSESTSTFGERLPRPATIVATLVALVAFWWFTFGDDTADTTPWGGISDLLNGIWALPSLALDPDAYQSWWSYMSDQEGWGEIFANTVDHAQLVLFSLSCATIIGIVLGVGIYRVKSLRPLVLSFFAVMLTVPSLALFAIFIPISFIGIGDRGPLIALTLYSILPILRNTVTGLEEVDNAVIETAKGMGLSAWQRLIRIELPLAWPVILTGIRVAALLNIGIAAIAKLVGGTGLGLYIDNGLNRFPGTTSVERMWTGVVFTILLALIFDLGFALVRRLTTPGRVSR
jgi:osmoprotectant transport system permease protein